MNPARIGRLFQAGTFLTLVTFSLAPDHGWAGNASEHVLESPRFLGRGRTYAAAWDSEDSTRGNPATLADPKLAFQLRTLPIDFLVGENSVGTFFDIIETLQKSTNDDLIVDMFKVFGKKFGERQYARMQLTPLSMRILSFELSPFLSFLGHIDPRVPQMPEIEVLFDTAIGANLTLALPILPTLNVGVTVRPMSRIYYAQRMSFINFVTILTDAEGNQEEIEGLTQSKSGFGIGSDLGLIYKPSADFRLGLTVHDLGFTSFSGEHAPPAYKERISFGSAWRAHIGSWNWDFFADYQDLLNPNDLNFWRLLHLGTEFGLSYATWDNDVGLSMGLNEGYLTFGLFAEIWFLRFDAVNYGVELGETPGQRQDRRWAFSAKLLTMNF